MNKYESLLHHHARPLLGRDEKIEGLSYLTAGLLTQTHYIARVTDRRLIVVRISMTLTGLKAIF